MGSSLDTALSLWALTEHHEGRAQCVVRLKTSWWKSDRGLHERRDLIFLRRQCRGFNFLEEDAAAVGAEEIIPRILNLGECEDGVYEVCVCNEHRDYETGCIEDYDYKLVRYAPEKETNTR